MTPSLPAVTLWRRPRGWGSCAKFLMRNDETAPCVEYRALPLATFAAVERVVEAAAQVAAHGEACLSRDDMNELREAVKALQEVGR